MKHEQSKNPNTEEKVIRSIESYSHDDKQRTNNPPASMAQFDRDAEHICSYAFDPHVDPTLDWAGKKEGLSFDVPTTSIHIHESIKPNKIISSVQSVNDDYDEVQLSLFETPLERIQRRREAIKFYQHGVNWSNRLIAGDNLVIMNSLLEKEGMAGQVQMMYIDPPYGIKYGSNFQPFVNKRDVKDKKDEDLTQEPEMIKAFRDTWELGIHSYLTYMRNRLLLTRELLADSGSVFIQISDENVHLVRNLCDEIFGVENFVVSLIVKKKGTTTSTDSVNDYILWVCKDRKQMKLRKLFEPRKNPGRASKYTTIIMPDGERKSISALSDEQIDQLCAIGGRFARTDWPLASQDPSPRSADFVWKGKTYKCAANRHWTFSPDEQMIRLAEANRLNLESDRVSGIVYWDDWAYEARSNIWDDTGAQQDLIYVVQTPTKPIQRCMLMTTDPGDLVMDITCGSGTTAYVAEQWGRRWITCDTSRVAITLAKKRLMMAVYDYYMLAHAEQGVTGGFTYKTVPRVTLKSIACDEPVPRETLYDQPEIDSKKVRVSGPFTVEALPAPVVKPLLELEESPIESATKHAIWRDELLATGIIGRGGDRIDFTRVEPLPGTVYLHADAETKEETPRRAVICFSWETKPLDSRMVEFALEEASKQLPKPEIIVFAAFQFDPVAANLIDEMHWPGVHLLKAQMNTDLMTSDLKRKRSSNQSFWLVGQPDVKLKKVTSGKYQGKYQISVDSFDYYDVKTGAVHSGSTSQIAMWMLDTNYDETKSVEPVQVFFPMDGKKDGWAKLAKTLRAEINYELIQQFGGTESLPFSAEIGTNVAVKIVDDRGIESLRIIKIEDNDDKMF